jgi:hypothetical protein
MELSKEEKEYIKLYEKTFHSLTEEEKEYVIKIKREGNTEKALKDLENFFKNDDKVL